MLATRIERGPVYHLATVTSAGADHCVAELLLVSVQRFGYRQWSPTPDPSRLHDAGPGAGDVRHVATRPPFHASRPIPRSLSPRVHLSGGQQ